MSLPCLCGATDCYFCGPAQGWPWCYEHKQSAQYCCSSNEEDTHIDENDDNAINANRLDNGWY